MNHPAAPAPLPAGLIALHGNRIEDLLDTVATWLQQHPLAPLESEIVLVQSNGMAEWIKMALARSAGICAAINVQLPARFMWQCYRRLLGPDQLPARSPMDKTALTWRLMRILPELLPREGYQPIADYLGGDDPARRFQLASRIADLYDQYQVYRPDWLAHWGQGQALLVDAAGRPAGLPQDQLWQALLWQHLLETLTPEQIAQTRPALHLRALEHLRSMAPAADPGSVEVADRLDLPRRVVLFGMTHVPRPTLELLAALSAHSQVLLAIPNPCRYHWADIMDGREWLRFASRRHPLRNGHALDQVGLESMHLHAHPLLAAWGRQARDFVRQLDAFDNAEQTRARFPHAHIDLFYESDRAEASLLQQVQDHIRDLLPIAEHSHPCIPPADRSIVFHIAHSPVRELEILHDQLLQLLAAPAPGSAALRPRDIVVMVPAIDAFAPAIRAVFGQYDRHDPRHIPFDIADLSARASSPLMNAIEWLLQAPQHRCRLTDLSMLLEVPAIAARFGLCAEDLPRLNQWMSGAGIRWGLDTTHRSDLDLPACGHQNTALFGIERMLMGYAVGAAATQDNPYAGIEPYDEVGGLDAALAGALARMLDRLLQWHHDSRQPATPAQWTDRLRQLITDLTQPSDEYDQHTLATLDSALQRWLEACFDAGYEEALPLEVVGEAWLGALEAPTLNKRFRAGGVTFCTLMPMRAIPFEVVCLLGMNDGDYPRRSPGNDFDLMAQPGQQRPGDRGRRDDDRQLMLEALLSARRVLYLSWCGHNVRDNSVQPPSVLVAQLRDYLTAGWSHEVVSERTTEHPLQPFSRRYFEPGTPLFTYAREWRTAHLSEPGVDPDETSDSGEPFRSRPSPPDLTLSPLTIAQLAGFMRNPVKAFFRQRLGVIFEDVDEALADEEVFSFSGLEEYTLIDTLLQQVRAQIENTFPTCPDPDSVRALLEARLDHHQRAGELPLGAPGRHVRAALRDQLLPMLMGWHQARLAHPIQIRRRGVRVQHDGVVLEDWLDQLALKDPHDCLPHWLELQPGRLLADAGKGTVRPDSLLLAWVRSLVAAAAEVPCAGVLIGRDAAASITPMAQDVAQSTLAALLETWRLGLETPLPVAPRTAIAYLTDNRPAAVYEGDRFRRGEAEDAYLARCFPDYTALLSDGRFPALARTLYAPLLAWIETQVEIQPHPDCPATPEHLDRSTLP